MLGHPWTWAQFYEYILSQEMEDSEHSGSLGSFADSSNTLFEQNWYYTTVMNPNFGFDDILRHVYHDKVGDLARTASVGAGVTAAMAPVTPAMLAAGPKGAAARLGIGVAATIVLSSPMNTADFYLDMVNIGRTQEIGGTSVVGHSIRSR